MDTTRPKTAFCIDFNWDRLDRFSSPGLYGSADPVQHIDWYESLGVDVLQSFFATINGYSWYQSDLMPATPGAEQFMTRLSNLARSRGISPFGYFAPGGNLQWQRNHPDQSRDIPGLWHIPFTERYTDFCARLIEEALDRVDVDGFMIDWLWNPEPIWTPVERELYVELFSEPFPSSAPPQDVVEEYGRRAVQRMWNTIRDTAKAYSPSTVLWLSCNNLTSPQLTGVSVVHEADWLMNEHPDPSALEIVRSLKGPHAQLMQCVSGWGAQHNALDLLQGGNPELGYYGFARADELTTLPKPDSANGFNIEAFRSYLHSPMRRELRGRNAS